MNTQSSVGSVPSPRGRKRFVRGDVREPSVREAEVPTGTLPVGEPYKTKMTATFEVVTPAIATEWLKANTHNRRYKPRNINKMSQDIRNDRWQLNGEAIKFATVRDKDVLVDGQNRLLAIVESEKAVPVLVVRGLELSQQESMDLGARRILKDMLEMRGEVNCTVLAAGTVAYWQYEKDPLNPGRKGESDYPSVAAALETLERHPRLRESTRLSSKFQEAHIPPSIGVALHYITSTLAPDDAAYFWDTLASGIGLQRDDPIYVLREFLRKDYETHYQRRNTYELWAIITKGWNAYREGRKIQSLRFVSGGARPEQFPELR